jgi:hypothetical protein
MDGHHDPGRLVREGGHERHPEQLSELFRDLGPLPPAEDCDDRAFWVAAMINPVGVRVLSLGLRVSRSGSAGVSVRVCGCLTPGLWVSHSGSAGVSV